MDNNANTGEVRIILKYSSEFWLITQKQSHRQWLEKQCKWNKTETLSLKTSDVLSLCCQYLHSAATFQFLNWKVMKPSTVTVTFLWGATSVYILIWTVCCITNSTIYNDIFETVWMKQLFIKFCIFWFCVPGIRFKRMKGCFLLNTAVEGMTLFFKSPRNVSQIFL